MKTTNWKDLAELIGIGAIVASLIFVGMQMRQTHEIALVTLYQMRADAAREVASNGLQSNLNAAWTRIAAGADVSDAELNLAFTDTFILFNHFENSHFLYMQGYLPEEHWQSDLYSLARELQDPTVRKFWNELRPSFRQSFADSVESAAAEIQ